MHCSFNRCITVNIMALIVLICSGCTQEKPETTALTSSNAVEIKEALKDHGEISKVLSTAENLRNYKPKQRHLVKKADKEKGGDSHASQEDVVISDQGGGIAYIAEKHGRKYVIHNGKAGNPHSDIDHLRISPDGKRVAYSKSVGNFYQMIVDDIAGNMFIDVYDAVYSPDSRHVAYLAEGLDRAMNIVLDGKSVDSYANVVSSIFLFSHDSSKLVYHVRPYGGGTTSAQLVIYDLKTGSKSTKQCLDIPLVMNSAKTRIAAAKAISGDKQQIFDFALASPEVVRSSDAYDAVSLLSLSDDGKSIAFAAIKGNHQYLVLDGKERVLPDNLAITAPPFFHPKANYVGVVMKTKERFDNTYHLYQSNISGNSPRVQARLIKEPVFGIKKDDVAYVSAENDAFFMVVNGKSGPKFEAVVSPLFSPDGSKLIYRAREGAKRCVVVADIASNVHRRLPDYEMVFPVSIAADGKSFAYGVKEEDKFILKVEKL